jgi:hypothetical protein
MQRISHASFRVIFEAKPGFYGMEFMTLNSKKIRSFFNSKFDTCIGYIKTLRFDFGRFRSREPRFS